VAEAFGRAVRLVAAQHIVAFQQPMVVAPIARPPRSPMALNHLYASASALSAQ
jgi:hypothetical protein